MRGRFPLLASCARNQRNGGAICVLLAGFADQQGSRTGKRWVCRRASLLFVPLRYLLDSLVYIWACSAIPKRPEMPGADVAGGIYYIRHFLLCRLLRFLLHRLSCDNALIEMAMKAKKTASLLGAKKHIQLATGNPRIQGSVGAPS